MRQERNIGVRRIQNELIRHHNLKLSLASIHKALKIKDFQPLARIKRHKKYNRYSRPVPGDRVQVDTCKITNNVFQYTAIDDCTRFRILEIYTKKNAVNTLDFIDKMIEQFPFPIQRVQTDRGTEFFAVEVQEKLMDNCIKFRCKS
jgi:transposase InsO family protein